jgi:hypothetical protein
MFSVKSLLICLASTVFYSASNHLFSLYCVLLSLLSSVQPLLFSDKPELLCSASFVKLQLLSSASNVLCSASTPLFSLRCSLISLDYFVQPPSLSFNFFLQPPMFSVQLQHLCSASAVMSNDTISVRDAMFCPASTVLFQPQLPVLQLFSVSTPLTYESPRSASANLFIPPLPSTESF